MLPSQSLDNPLQDLLKIPVGPALYALARSGFIAKGTSLNQWCQDYGFKRQNVRKALLGEWNGPKAKNIRLAVLQHAFCTQPVSVDEKNLRLLLSQNGASADTVA